MSFNLSTFVFQIVNFVVLAYILHRLLYRPLRAAIDKRRGDAERAKVEADAARQDALALKSTMQSQLAEMDKQREEILQKVRTSAETERQRLLAEGQREIERRQAESRVAIEHQREEALNSLAAEIRTEAVSLAERLLKESVGAGLQAQLAQRLVDTLARLSAEDKAQVQRQWVAGDGALLETAAALDTASAHKIADAIKTIVGQQVKVAQQVKPSLLGGVRLRIGGLVWDATLAAQLETINSQPEGGGIHG